MWVLAAVAIKLKVSTHYSNWLPGTHGCIRQQVDTSSSTTDQTELEIWGKAQRESARRPKSDWGKIGGGGKW